jgi:hypothetical protein
MFETEGEYLDRLGLLTPDEEPLVTSQSRHASTWSSSSVE